MNRCLVSALRVLLAATLLWGAGIGAARAADAAQTVVHVLDYIAVDYAEAVDNGRVRNPDEYKEMVGFATQVGSLLGELPPRAERAALQADAAALAALIDARAPVSEVAARATALRQAVVRSYGLQVAPKAAPDVKIAAALYAAHCAACHGAQGLGDGPSGRHLDPAPSNFHDRERMAQRSVHGLYNTITLGVAGTGMAAFPQFSDEERWALAFLAAGFAADDGLLARGEALWREGRGRSGFPDLGNVATLSAQEVRQRFGEEAVAVQAFLQAQPQALAASQPSVLDVARDTLAQSERAYGQGARAEALQLAIQAYLEGFELAEASVSNIDAALSLQIEREMMAYRSLVQAGAPLERVQQQANTVQELLDQARERVAGAALSPATAFVSALVILLREGLEAILVVAAILAFLRRAGRGDARRWVHAGWAAALVLGAATWVVSRELIEISGAGREVTEGVTALLAAAMLLYVGYWLHSKSRSAAWQRFIGDQVGAALSRGTLWTLALVTFLAVYREAFETVLFYQALAAQAGTGSGVWIAGGVGVALLALLAFGWAILRASVRLPLGLFFSVSGILLLVLAVVFTGQGVAALQEAGRIGADAVPFVSIPMLGIHPTLQSLGAQLVVSLACMAVLWRAARPAASPR